VKYVQVLRTEPLIAIAKIQNPSVELQAALISCQHGIGIDYF
jgi:hypothetical protein